jgi:hypothetical protein
VTIFNKLGALYWSALILGLIGASGAGLVVWFVSAFAAGYITDPISWLFVVLPLCSVVITFKWIVVGGVLLILESLALIYLGGLGAFVSARLQSDYSSEWILFIPLVAGLFLLLSGVLFLISRRQQQKRREV